MGPSTSMRGVRLACWLAILGIARIRGRELLEEEAEAVGPGGWEGSERPWLDASAPLEQRLEALLAAMSPEQKRSQLQSDSFEGDPDLGIPPFIWQAECIHGAKTGPADTVAELGSGNGATIYPQNLGLAATFDDGLARRMADQISDEMRAIYNRIVRRGDTGEFTSCFAPHVTIVRDPRWGRQSETFGEDPLLQARMAVAFVLGLQGDDPRYLKVAATCKHFLGHDLEKWHDQTVFAFDAWPAPDDLRDSFLPPFQACVAAAAGTMCAYNSINGRPSCTNPDLLVTLLREELGFQGYVMTDNKALDMMIRPPPDGPGFAGGDAAHASANALRAGADIFCKSSEALELGDVAPSDLDRATRRVLAARLRMGHLDPQESLPWAALNESTVGAADHAAVARKVSLEGCVLLKNDGTLPLNESSLASLALIGPFAANETYLLGRYYGQSAGPVTTPLAALRAALPGVKVSYDPDTAFRYSSDNAEADVKRCEEADACILFLGTRISRLGPKDWEELPDSAYDQLQEGEGHDRESLGLPESQEQLWKMLAEKTSKPLVVVLIHGGGLDVGDMHAEPRIGAILSAWLPGQHGSRALPDLLLGRESPSGRLPVTWFRNSYVALDMTDLRMKAEGDYPGRTYRYWKGEEPVYRFGHGLSYVDWGQSDASVAAGLDDGSGAGATANVTLWHGGGVRASTAVLLFMSYLGPGGYFEYGFGGDDGTAAALPASGCAPNANATALVHRLVAYARTPRLSDGDSQQLSFALPLARSDWRSAWGGFGDPDPPCGTYALRFGVDEPEVLVVELQA